MHWDDHLGLPVGKLLTDSGDDCRCIAIGKLIPNSGYDEHPAGYW
jgi:hypothetical protein